MLGQIALYSGGYQTIRTDVPGLYGDVQFTTKGKEELGCVYARRNDYLDYYKIAEKYFQAALNNKGTAALVTVDDRSYANNPFQRHFQYTHDLALSPESIFEVGNIQGGQSGQTTTSEYSYALDARLVVVVIRLRLASRLERYVLFPLSIMVSLKRVICVEMLV